MEKHEWRTVTVHIPDYGYGQENVPTLTDWLYKLESEGWEIVTVFNSAYGTPTILCRKDFVPAPMRTQD